MILATGGGASIIKDLGIYIQTCGWNGVYFSGLQLYECVWFSRQKYINGVSFSPKSIWMGKIWKKVYEWVQFSLLEVYEWVCFLTSPIWMGWGRGTQAARPYPKSRQVTASYPPPFHPRDTGSLKSELRSFLDDVLPVWISSCRLWLNFWGCRVCLLIMPCSTHQERPNNLV